MRACAEKLYKGVSFIDGIGNNSINPSLLSDVENRRTHCCCGSFLFKGRDECVCVCLFASPFLLFTYSTGNQIKMSFCWSKHFTSEKSNRIFN